MAVIRHWVRLGSRAHAEDGQAAVNIITIAVVLVAALITAWLLARTTIAARNINQKAENIAQTGVGINTATDSVVQLTRTNETAGSILASAQPVQGQLNQIIALARSIDGLAVSINSTAGRINTTAKTVNGTAGTINSTAGTINSTAGTIGATARGINGKAAEILDVARRIDVDVELINRNIDGTIGLANAIKGDTGNILGVAVSAHRNACEIDRKLLGQHGTDGHC